jgi:hypothetical protein
VSQSADPASPRPSRKPGKSSKSPSAGSEKTQSTPSWRRWVFWAVLIVLIGALGAEFRAQAAFNRQLKICQDAVENSSEKSAHHAAKVLYRDIQPNFATQPDNDSMGVRGFAKCQIYSWRWQGIRAYKLRLIVDEKTGHVMSVESGDLEE